MGRLTAAVIDAWRRARLSRPTYPRARWAPSRGDVPSPLPRRRVVVVGAPPKWVVMACPCGHGHTINLNLANEARARWRIDLSNRPSISPSVDVKDPERRCHFWLRDGRVDWA